MKSRHGPGTRVTLMTGTMKAAVYHGREDVRLEEVPIPRAGEGEVVVKVEAALTCGTDRKMYLRDHPLFRPPFVFGHEFSGTVSEVGRGVERFREGMRVTAANSAPCNRCYYCRVGRQSLCENLFLHLSGAFAEYAAVPAPIVGQNLLEIPEGVSFKAAAMLEPLACVVHGMSVADVLLGDTVAVVGTGPIGLMFVRLATLRGARVIAVDMKEERLRAAKACGAELTVNAGETEDVVKAVRALTESGRGVDVAIEAAGLPEVWEKTIRMVRKGGTANLFGGCKSGTTITVDTALVHYSEVTIKGAFHHNPRSVSQALTLIQQGAIDEEVFVSRELELERIDEILRGLVEQEGIKTAVIPQGEAKAVRGR